MVLVARKPRPLKRDRKTFRDDRLFIVACDDTYAPKQYFESFKISRVHVYVVPTEDGTSSAPHVLQRLMGFERQEGDELWMLLDTDHCTEPDHIRTFQRALKEAREKGVKLALSMPCFELWLLLHGSGEASVGELTTARRTEDALRSELGRYDKTRLDPRCFTFAHVKVACERALQLDLSAGHPEIPQTPGSQMYLLWRAIVAKALPSQLPEELRALLVAIPT
jgi:hypothetical protein